VFLLRMPSDRELRQRFSDNGGRSPYSIEIKEFLLRVVSSIPAKYRSSEVMTFLVNSNGKVYQKDLGVDTAKVAGTMEKYNPDNIWKFGEEEQAHISARYFFRLPFPPFSHNVAQRQKRCHTQSLCTCRQTALFSLTADVASDIPGFFPHYITERIIHKDQTFSYMNRCDKQVYKRDYR
jgi:hypothetical protein